MSKKEPKAMGIKSLISDPVLFENVRMEIFGNKRASVEGCAGVLEYKTEEIVIKTCMSMKLCFVGKNMKICCMDKDSLVIEGFIASVSYIK